MAVAPPTIQPVFAAIHDHGAQPEIGGTDGTNTGDDRVVPLRRTAALRT